MKLNKIFFILALVTFAGSVFSYDLPSRYKTFQDGDVVNQGDMNGMQDQWRNYFINEVYQGGTMITIPAGDSLIASRVDADTVSVTNYFYLGSDIVPDVDVAHNIGTEDANIDSLHVEVVEADTVQIGVKSPQAGLLHIRNDSGNSTPMTIGGGDTPDIIFQAAEDWGSTNSPEPKWSLNWRGRPDGSSHYFSLEDEINSAERLRVNNSGFVGIGHTSPSTYLHVSKGESTVPTLADDAVALLQNNDAVGEQVSLVLLSGNAGINDIDFGDTDDSDIGRIRYTHGGGSSNNAFQFWTNTAARFEIQSDGNVTIDVDGTMNSGDHDLEIRNGASFSEVNAGENQFTTTSDSTLKENIAKVTDAMILSRVQVLDVKTYDWKDSIIPPPDSVFVTQVDTFVSGRDTTYIKSRAFSHIDSSAFKDAKKWAGEKRVGLISQEFNPIAQAMGLPVEPGKIDWSHVQAAMLMAIKQLSYDNDELRNRVSALEARVTALEGK